MNLQRTLAVLILLAGLVLGGALWAWRQIDREPAILTPANIGPVPAFTLQADDGTEFHSPEDMQGKVWAVDFFFTRCRGICPTLTSRMLDIQDRLEGRPGWGLLSITVDPDHDTPEVLAAHAAERGADPERWRFLTGEKDYVHDVIRTGFLLPVQEAVGDTLEPVLHSPRIVVVDRAGVMQGAFDAFDPESMERMYALLDRLVGPAS